MFSREFTIAVLGLFVILFIYDMGFVFTVLGVVAICFLYMILNKQEGFKAGMAAVRCGVDLPTCHPGLQCFNGFCSRPFKPVLPANELPVYP